MFNFLGSWTLFSKFSNSFSEVGVDMRTRARHKIWLMLERKARISGSPHHSSTSLHSLAANFANVKSQNSLPASVNEKNMMPPASDAMTKPCPVRDSATLTHRLNRFQNLLFISGKLPEPRYFKIDLENWVSWASIGYYLKGKGQEGMGQGPAAGSVTFSRPTYAACWATTWTRALKPWVAIWIAFLVVFLDRFGQRSPLFHNQ